VPDAHEPEWDLAAGPYQAALEQAELGLAEGGVPVGAALAQGGEVIAVGRNRRVQHGDPIAHGEMDCLRSAGRRRNYADTVLFTTLAPCSMCTGAILLFEIPVVVVGDDTTFAGELDLLKERGTKVIVLKDDRSRALMLEFQRRYPETWAEDIGEAEETAV